MSFDGRKIQVSCLPELDSFEKSKAESALVACFDKLNLLVKNDVLLNAHFKQHETGGKRAKHSVHLKLSLPGKTLVASDSGWELLSALQSALKTLERETKDFLKK